MPSEQDKVKVMMMAREDKIRLARLKLDKFKKKRSAAPSNAPSAVQSPHSPVLHQQPQTAAAAAAVPAVSALPYSSTNSTNSTTTTTTTTTNTTTTTASQVLDDSCSTQPAGQPGFYLHETTKETTISDQIPNNASSSSPPPPPRSMVQGFLYAFNSLLNENTTNINSNISNIKTTSAADAAVQAINQTPPPLDHSPQTTDNNNNGALLLGHQDAIVNTQDDTTDTTTNITGYDYSQYPVYYAQDGSVVDYTHPDYSYYYYYYQQQQQAQQDTQQQQQQYEHEVVGDSQQYINTDNINVHQDLHQHYYDGQQQEYDNFYYEQQQQQQQPLNHHHQDYYSTSNQSQNQYPPAADAASVPPISTTTIATTTDDPDSSYFNHQQLPQHQDHHLSVTTHPAATLPTSSSSSPTKHLQHEIHPEPSSSVSFFDQIQPQQQEEEPQPVVPVVGETRAQPVDSALFFNQIQQQPLSPISQQQHHHHHPYQEELSSSSVSFFDQLSLNPAGSISSNTITNHHIDNVHTTSPVLTGGIPPSTISSMATGVVDATTQSVGLVTNHSATSPIRHEGGVGGGGGGGGGGGAFVDVTTQANSHHFTQSTATSPVKGLRGGMDATTQAITTNTISTASSPVNINHTNNASTSPHGTTTTYHSSTSPIKHISVAAVATSTSPDTLSSTLPSIISQLHQELDHSHDERVEMTAQIASLRDLLEQALYEKQKMESQFIIEKQQQVSTSSSDQTTMSEMHQRMRGLNDREAALLLREESILKREEELAEVEDGNLHHHRHEMEVEEKERRVKELESHVKDQQALLNQEWDVLRLEQQQYQQYYYEQQQQYFQQNGSNGIIDTATTPSSQYIELQSQYQQLEMEYSRIQQELQLAQLQAVSSSSSSSSASNTHQEVQTHYPTINTTSTSTSPTTTTTTTHLSEIKQLRQQLDTDRLTFSREREEQLSRMTDEYKARMKILADEYAWLEKERMEVKEMREKLENVRKGLERKSDFLDARQREFSSSDAEQSATTASLKAQTMQLSSEIQSVSLLNVKLQTELGEWKNKVLELETANRQLQGNVERLTEMLNTDNNSGRGGDGEMKLLHAVRSPVINANTSTSGRGEEELVNVIMRLTETNKGLVSRVDQLQRQIQYQTPGFGSDQLPAASATNVNSSSSSYKRRDSFSKYVKGYHQHNHNNQQQHQHINIGSSPVISSATSLFSPMQVQQQYHQQPAAAAAAAVDLRLSTTRREVEGIRSYFTEEDMQEFSDETRQILFGN